MTTVNIPTREQLSVLSDGLSTISQMEGRSEALGDMESDRLKKAVVSLYAFCTTVANSSYFWNFGLKDAETDAKIRAALDEYDYLITDGFSEQLYYYTLDRLELPNFDGVSLLEIGCGLGAGLNLLARTVPGPMYHGLDICDTAIRRAKSMFSRHNMQFVCGDAENLPFDSAQYDVIINIESCHNYPDVSQFLREASRVLKPGGKLAIIDFFSENRHEAFLELLADLSNGLALEKKIDVSDLVKASIRERLKDGSFAMRHFHDQIGTNPIKKLVLRKLYEVALGSEFVGHETASIYRAAHRIFLQSTKRFTGDRYILHIAVKQ